VAQTVTIGEQKVCPESLKFSATQTPQVENPSDSKALPAMHFLLQKATATSIAIFFQV